jgi:hypothetical protein
VFVCVSKNEHENFIFRPWRICVCGPNDAENPNRPNRAQRLFSVCAFRGFVSVCCCVCVSDPQVGLLVPARKQNWLLEWTGLDWTGLDELERLVGSVYQ